MNKITISLMLLLFSCSREQPKTTQKKEQETIIHQPETQKNDVEKAETPKVEEPKKEEKPPEAFFIHEGGDIQEFDEEGNPIEQ